jgi:D-amino-acid dehydrogenase
VDVGDVRNCDADRYAVNKERMVRLAEYSRDCIRALRNEIGIDYEGRQQGTLQLFRTQAQFDGAAKDIEVLRQAGVPFEVLSREQLATPSRRWPGARQAGGRPAPAERRNRRLPDVHHQAGRDGEAIGVRFEFGVDIHAIESQGDQITGVRTDKGSFTADRYVVALGSYSRLLLRQFFRVPVYPLKGYSITVPITDAAQAPVSTILDETYKIAITRFENRIRVGGMAEIAGYSRNSTRAAARPWRWSSPTCSRAAATSSRPASGPACAR